MIRVSRVNSLWSEWAGWRDRDGMGVTIMRSIAWNLLCGEDSSVRRPIQLAFSSQPVSHGKKGGITSQAMTST